MSKGLYRASLGLVGGILVGFSELATSRMLVIVAARYCKKKIRWHGYESDYARTTLSM